MNFSANLGYLWQDHTLPDAIRAASIAGFSAVECHWPYDTNIDELTAALAETKLPMLCLNTSRGETTKSDMGLSALPDRIPEAHAAIDAAINYAIATSAQNVHVMAGLTNGPEAHDTFVANLRYAVDIAKPAGITILIEPLNQFDAPGYFLQTTDQAMATLDEVGADNLKILFDCYHVARTEGDVAERLARLLPHIGHIQFASVPERTRPDHGTLDYGAIFQTIRDLGYTSPLGAEYKPNGPTEESLGWMTTL